MNLNGIESLSSLKMTSLDSQEMSFAVNQQDFKVFLVEFN